MANKKVKKKSNKQRGKGINPAWPQLAGNRRRRLKKANMLKKVPRALRSNSKANKYTKVPKRESFNKLYITRTVYKDPPVGVVNKEKPIQDRPSQLQPQQLQWDR